MTTQPSPTKVYRVEGPNGVRLVAPATGGFWRVQHESGPDESDPLEEKLEEALGWARELVSAKGTPLHAPGRVRTTATSPSSPRPSPNENATALAKTRPRLAPRPGVLGRYEYAAEDKPLRSRR